MRLLRKTRALRELQKLVTMMATCYLAHGECVLLMSPQKVAVWKGNGTPYFRKIQVGEIL